MKLKYAIRIIGIMLGIFTVFAIARVYFMAPGCYIYGVYFPFSKLQNPVLCLVLVFLLFKWSGKVTSKNIHTKIKTQLHGDINETTDRQTQWKRLMLVAGIILCIYGFSMDTSIEVPQNGILQGLGLPDRINNLELMNKRFIYIIVGSAIIVIAIVLINYSSKKDNSNQPDNKDLLTKLSELYQLKEKGVISEEEFRVLKENIIKSENDL